MEITGTNFRIEPDPAPGVFNGPVIKPALVTFEGGPGSMSEEALQIAVWSSTTIYCVTPPLDPYTQTTVFTADAVTDVMTSATHGLLDGALVQLSNSGGALPAGLSSEVPYWIVNATTNTFQLSLSEGGAVVDFSDAGTGTHSTMTDGAYDLRIQNLDDNGDPIAGEEVVASKLFRPLRPNLSVGSHLGDVVDAFMNELRRQVVENVSWTVSTDYDEDSGDVEVAFPSKLPHIVVAAVSVEESSRQVAEQRDDNYNDPDVDGDFVTRRSPSIVDVSGSLVGVSDDSNELLALFQAVKQFFRKTYRLRVPRDPSDSSAGRIEYDMRSIQGTSSFGPRDDNIQFFTTDFVIRDVILEQIPGIPAKATSGVPVDGYRSTEATIEVGKTVADDILTEDVEGLILEFEPLP